VLIALPLLAAVLFSQPFLTSAKEVMFSSLFVCLSGCFCLFVCLLATLRKKTYKRICMKFSGKVDNGSMNK